MRIATKESACSQSPAMSSACGERQLQWACAAHALASCHAWCVSCFVVHAASGVMMNGVTQPSSEVMGFVSIGCGAAALGAPPQTMASCVATPPVRWTDATDSWCTSFAPTSASPTTEAKTPSSINGSKQRRKCSCWC